MVVIGFHWEPGWRAHEGATARTHQSILFRSHATNKLVTTESIVQEDIGSPVQLTISSKKCFERILL